ncbi:MAG: MFS transporter, partial [Planctomycetota bacterium]|nr:MFS transporter [Planctomycetota bacterium]
MDEIELPEDLLSPPVTPGEAAAPPEGPEPEDRPYDILRNRDFSLYLIGRLVAQLGQQMLVMAVGWEIYDRTGSGMALGLVGLTQMIPMFLFTLPAGHVADNHSRKRIVVLKRIVLARTAVLAAASLALARLSTGRAPMACIYLCLFVISSARTFMWAANAAFLPHLVDRKDLSRAINWNAGAFQLASIVGPLMAGGIIEWMGGLHFPGPAAPVYAIQAVT